MLAEQDQLILDTAKRCAFAIKRKWPIQSPVLDWEDLVQTAAEHAARKCQETTEPHKVYATTHYRTLDTLNQMFSRRINGVRLMRAEFQELTENLEPVDPVNFYAGVEYRDNVESALCRLKRKARIYTERIIKLKLLGKSNLEISEALGISDSYVGVLISKVSERI